MQKVIALSINLDQLMVRSDETFSISEPGALNELLQEGWEIEDWSFLTDDPVNGKIPMLVVLNDNMLAANEEEVWREGGNYPGEDALDMDDDELDRE